MITSKWNQYVANNYKNVCFVIFCNNIKCVTRLVRSLETRNRFFAEVSKNSKWRYQSTSFVKETYLGKFQGLSMSPTSLFQKNSLFQKTRLQEIYPAETSEISEFRYFTQLSIKKFPQSILRWGFHMIFPIDLSFQSHQIQLYDNLF